jgi:hypothetical protein
METNDVYMLQTGRALLTDEEQSCVYLIKHLLMDLRQICFVFHNITSRFASTPWEKPRSDPPHFMVAATIVRSLTNPAERSDDVLEVLNFGVSALR